MLAFLSSRSADQVLCTQAGPELAVAATKTFLTQLAALYLLGISLADLPREEKKGLLKDLFGLPYWLQWTLGETGPVESIGRRLASYDHLFLIARGLNVPVALEGALKFKEVTYVHAEGCAAGELKHGPFALLGPGTPVVALIAADQHRASMLTTLRETKARGSPIMAVASEEECEVSYLADEIVSVPRVDPVFSPVLNTIVCQLLSYYCAKERGCPIDQPRNLAKSVTVP